MRRRIRCDRLLGIAILLLSTCFCQLPAHAGKADLYRFGPGDVLAITVFGQKALSGRFRINPEGTISFPLLGQVPAAHLTRPELESRMSGLLGQQMPGVGKISVDVAEYAPVFIIGDIEKPGRYEFHPGMIPLELLAIGGGMKRLLLDPQHDPTLQLITLEQQLTDHRLVRYEQAITRARLLAEINGRPFDGTIDPADDQPIMDQKKKHMIDDEKAIYRVRADALATREKALAQQRDSYNQEINALTQSIALHNEELHILEKEVNSSQSLLNRGLTTETKVFTLKRELSSTKRYALDLQSFLARAHEHQLAVDFQIKELHTARADQLAQALRELDLSIARTSEQIAATSSTLAALRSASIRGTPTESSSIAFAVVRSVGGEYRTVPIGEHDVLQARDILEVRRQLVTTGAGPARAALPSVPTVDNARTVNRE